MKCFQCAIWGVLVLAVQWVNAGESPPPPYKGSSAFEQLKLLEGHWEGTSNMPQAKQVKVEYRVTSNGSAVVETIFPGTPMEMVTVYHDNDKKLSMTHYCSMNNQPSMTLKSEADKQLRFAFDKGLNVNPKKDMHMHNLTLSIVDKDNIVQTWTMFKDGKNAGETKIDLARVAETQ